MSKITSRLIAVARLLVLSMALASAAATGAAAATGLPIIVYHQIMADGEALGDAGTAISLGRFEAQMRILHELGFATLDTNQVIEFIAGRATPSAKPVVAIHLDDGWKSAQLALPILERYGFRAAFWVIPGTGIGWPHM